MNKSKGFYRKLLILVLPIAFQNFMSAAVSASDAVMLGFIDQDSLAAVSLAGQVQFVFNLFLIAMTIGTTILAAQYWGQKNRNAVEQILAISLKFSLLVSVLFYLIATVWSEQLMRIFTSDQRLIRYGAGYLKVVGLSYVFAGVSQIYLCIMKNCGRTLKSAVIGSSSMVLNIVLNYFLIFGAGAIPALGIAGAALATVISRLVEVVWVMIEAAKKDSVKFRMVNFYHTDKQLLSDMITYTAPVLGNELVWGFGFTMYTVIMGHLGSDAVAANSIANIVKNLIACLCLGVGSGGGIMVGYELGMGNMERAKEYGRRLCKVSVVGGVVSGLVLLLLMPVILNFVDLTETAHTYLTGMLFMCTYYLIGKSVNSTTIAGIFCAGGDSRFGLGCDAIVMWAIVVPLGFLAAFYFRLPVLWVYFIINLDEMVKLPLVYWNYKKYRWLKDLTR